MKVFNLIFRFELYENKGDIYYVLKDNIIRFIFLNIYFWYRFLFFVSFVFVYFLVYSWRKI